MYLDAIIAVIARCICTQKTVKMTQLFALPVLLKAFFYYGINIIIVNAEVLHSTNYLTDIDTMSLLLV